MRVVQNNKNVKGNNAKMRKYLKSNKGITLITLTTTIVVMLIISVSITININPYIQRKNKTNLETDILKLKEEISYYYSKNKTLPIINKYTNINMLEKNINDNENYYVIDLSKIGEEELNYGKDYYKINNKEELISNLLDIYIMNEQSHTIYYPKGIEYNSQIYYTTMSLGQVKIEDIPISKIEITGEKSGKVGEQIILNAKVIPEFVKNTGVIWSSSDKNLATVNENGKVTLIKEGTVTITAVSKDDNSISETYIIDIK